MAIASLIVSIIAILISGISVWITRKQYLSPLRPEIWSRWYHLERYEGKVMFEIENRSPNVASIIDVIPLTKNISLYQPFRRYDLTNEKDDRLVIVCRYTGNDMDKDEYRLKIKYADKEGNKYKATLLVMKGNSYIE